MKTKKEPKTVLINIVYESGKIKGSTLRKFALSNNNELFEEIGKIFSELKQSCNDVVVLTNIQILSIE